jgi:hypothetical protein
MWPRSVLRADGHGTTFLDPLISVVSLEAGPSGFRIPEARYCGYPPAGERSAGWRRGGMVTFWPWWAVTTRNPSSLNSKHEPFSLVQPPRWMHVTSLTSSPMITWACHCFFSFPRSRMYFPHSELFFRSLCILHVCSHTRLKFLNPLAAALHVLPLHFSFPSLSSVAPRCRSELGVAGVSIEIRNTAAETNETQVKRSLDGVTTVRPQTPVCRSKNANP